MSPVSLDGADPFPRPEVRECSYFCVGFSEALSWLAENLEEVALDQEAEGYDPSAEGTPLVPISREAVEAMASPLFTEVLEGVGVAPPADEQVRPAAVAPRSFLGED